jgi:hypothetical protein
MAIFKLGSIVTSIVGSIGGTTFKRGPGNLVISKKSMGASRSKLQANKQLGAIANIFQRWQQLTEYERNAWVFVAPGFLFPDKFGVMRALTGRQLFTKLNIQALPAGFVILDPSGINSVVPAFELSQAFIYTNGDSATAIVNVPAGVMTYLVQAQCSNQKIFTPVFSKRKVIATGVTSGNATIEFTEGFFAENPHLNNTSSVVIFVTAINEFGFKSVTQSVRAFVNA